MRPDIESQRAEAEILIGWTQLLLVAFFALLYAIAPKSSFGTPFRPVPYALAAYGLFTLFRLWLAYHRWLPNWFLFISIIVDVTLLLGLIWTFHWQYRQPAAFYLKAPTLLYVFIFISLRTLCFEPKFVLVTGISAAIGWVAMVAYALIDGSGGASVTHDYVAYLTSNLVMIGAEVDKVITILLVTAILAVALVRARRLLVRAVIQSATSRDLSRFLAPEVLQQVIDPTKEAQPGSAEVRRASVLFCDIEGFSGLAETYPPQVVIDILNEYFQGVQALVDRYGGAITQYQGDGILITFNAARSDPDHANHALSTAIDLQEMVAARTFAGVYHLRVRCGISTGELVAGIVGSSDRLLFTVYGDCVNVAARLQELNKQLGTTVLVAAETLAAADASLAMRPLGPRTIRGRQQPVTVYAR